MNMSFDESGILTAKICGMALFSFVSIIIGLLPMSAHAHFKRKKPGSDVRISYECGCKQLISHLSAFGGGVLLSTTFLHLLPEIRESIGSLRRENVLPNTRSLPLAELLMCLGFLFLYLIEELAHKIVARIRQSADKIGSRQSDPVIRFVNNVYANDTSDISDIFDIQLPDSSIRDPERHDEGPDTININGKRSSPLENHDKQKTDKVQNGNDQHFLSDAPIHDSAVVCQNESTIFFTEGSGKNLLLISALSVHEGFEGLAIGLESQPEAVWYMILGVGAHKAVIAFCIGVQMISSKLDRKVAILYIFFFATATSIGIAIGLFLYTGNGIFMIILQGLATGTLLHVVFFELLKPHSEHSPFSGVLIGFIFMALLKYYLP